MENNELENWEGNVLKEMDVNSEVSEAVPATMEDLNFSKKLMKEIESLKSIVLQQKRNKNESDP